MPTVSDVTTLMVPLPSFETVDLLPLWVSACKVLLSLLSGALLLSGTADISYRAVTWRWEGNCVRGYSALHCTHSCVAARMKASNSFLFQKTLMLYSKLGVDNLFIINSTLFFQNLGNPSNPEAYA